MLSGVLPCSEAHEMELSFIAWFGVGTAWIVRGATVGSGRVRESTCLDRSLIPGLAASHAHLRTRALVSLQNFRLNKPVSKEAAIGRGFYRLRAASRNSMRGRHRGCLVWWGPVRSL